jgi:hypothetical protein
MTCPSGPGLKIEAWTPVCRPLLFDVCIGTVDAGRPHGKILLHAIGNTRLGGDGQQDMLCGMRCAIVLHGGPIVGECKSPVRRLTAEHVLWGLQAARLGRR